MRLSHKHNYLICVFADLFCPRRVRIGPRALRFAQLLVRMERERGKRADGRNAEDVIARLHVPGEGEPRSAPPTTVGRRLFSHRVVLVEKKADECGRISFLLAVVLASKRCF